MAKKTKTLNQCLTDFEKLEMAALNLADNTRQAYRRDLEDLFRFLSEQGIDRVDQVSLQHLKSYQAELDRRGYKASTRARKTYAIKTFFKFLHHQEVTEIDVASRLTPPRREKQEPRFLSEEVLLQTGIRLAEVAALTLDDVQIPKRITQDRDNTGMIRVTRKGGNIQQVPLNYKACQALAAYIEVRPVVDHQSLWVTKFKTPMSRRAIQYQVKKYLDEAGIKGATVHTIRHTFATHHVARGTDLKTVQETIGHASLATTSVYVSLAKEAQRQALQENAL
jgi:site-specific recombinase XerD